MCYVRNLKNEFRNFPSSEGLGVCQLKNSFIFLNFIDTNRKESIIQHLKFEIPKRHDF